MKFIIDTHIHLDHYEQKDVEHLLFSDPSVVALIGVSYDLSSCKQNLTFAQKYEKFKPAFGWHPEQPLLSDTEFSRLLDWIKSNKQNMIAIGEVGLPFYLRRKSDVQLEPYIEKLEAFIELAHHWQMPIVLHAVYDDAPIVCNLLEKHSIKKAHFHWFKGDRKTLNRMMQNDYRISITPDVLYEEEIQELVRHFPLEQIMVETDGPWPFEGPFKNKLTHPTMIHSSINKMAEIKKVQVDEVYEQLFHNSKTFYQL